MTKKSRRIIFYIFLGAFIVLVPMIIFYALGFNLDIAKKTIVSTGGIYLKSIPADAEIYIDNKSKGTTTKLIKRLLPSIYEVSVAKEGYNTWQKIMTVEPQMVTKAQNILLVPFNPKISLVATESKEYTLFQTDKEELYYILNNNLYRSDNGKLLVKNVINFVIYKNGIIYLDNATGKIFELDLTTLKSASMFEQVFPSFNQGKWTMSDDNKKLLCQKDKSVEILWLLDDVAANSIFRKKGDIEKIDFGQKINNVIWYPRTDEHLIVATDNSILITELDNRLPRNTFTFITTEKPQILYNSSQRLLYFLSQNKLYQAEL